MADRIPRHSVNLTALTDDEGDPERAVQYAVRGPDGDLRVFGDQEWVADGRATEDGGGTVVHRDVTIAYGPWSDEAPGPAPTDEVDALKAEVAELRAEMARFEGSYGEWHILTGYRADGTAGPTIAGSTPLNEKLDRIRRLRVERPELVTWRMDRIEKWSRRVSEPMPADVLTEWVGYTPEGARIVCAELGIVWREAGLDAQA